MLNYNCFLVYSNFILSKSEDCCPLNYLFKLSCTENNQFLVFSQLFSKRIIQFLISLVTEIGFELPPSTSHNASMFIKSYCESVIVKCLTISQLNLILHLSLSNFWFFTLSPRFYCTFPENYSFVKSMVLKTHTILSYEIKN